LIGPITANRIKGVSRHAAILAAPEPRKISTTSNVDERFAAIF
jgi:hypothetical protein